MATIKVVIKKVRGKPVLNNSGETTIYIKYTHDQKHILESTGVRIYPNQWDGEENQNYPVKGPGRTSKNELIRQAREKVEKAVAKLNYSSLEPTIHAVKLLLQARGNGIAKPDVFALYERYLEDSSATKTPGTLGNLRRGKLNFEEYCHYKKIKPDLEKIDITFYNGYVKYLLEKRGMNNNTCGREVKNLKSFLNYCESIGFTISTDIKKFKVFKEKPIIIFLTQDELDRLYHFDFSAKPKLDRARDLFCMGCYTGLRWSDLSRLSKDHIEGNIIRMRAHKNKKDTLVPLVPRSAAILEKYDYHLPIIAEQNLNLYIKEACQLAGIDQPVEMAIYQGGKKTYTRVPKYQEVSTHTAVKTFITLCGQKGISAKVVSEITGKTVKIILDHYYGIDEKTIISEIARAFGTV